MKRFFWWTTLAIIVIIIGIFAWRIFYFYNAVKNNKEIVLGGNHFTALVNSNAAAPKGPVSEINIQSAKAPRLGKKDAKIKIVEFADFTCPFSKEVFPLIRELLAKYPDKIDFSLRFYSIGGPEHSGGKDAAKAALCALSQNKFWQFHDRLFLDQKNFSNDDLLNYAQQVGLDMDKFTPCFNSKIINDWVDEDSKAAVDANVRGTPTFFVNGNNKVEGVIPVADWEKALNLK